MTLAETIEQLKRQKFLAGLTESMVLEENNPNPFYSFTYTSHAGGFMQEVMLALYKKAIVDHNAWIQARSKLGEGNP